MDIERYQEIYNYLKYQQFPINFNSQQKQKLKNQANNFTLKNNFIYKCDKRKQNNLLRLIRRSELEPILFMFHNDPTAAHFQLTQCLTKSNLDTIGHKCMK